MKIQKKIPILIFFLSLSLYSQDFLSLHKIDSVESISKCYAINPYEFQKKQISSNEILNSCTRKVMSWTKLSVHSESELLDIAEEVRKGHRIEASLPIFKIVAAQSKNRVVCDNMKLYSAIMAGLRHPVHFPSEETSDVKAAYEVMDVCLSHKSFYEDLQEELEKDDAYLTQNLCQFFNSKNKKISQCQMQKNSG
ncbi:MAG: hypothetical protein JNL11_13340 [Bdellovibrionaceae bacterium]|nr:hypothetical protein [Pseudobdellovibrionaceae bacterium]